MIKFEQRSILYLCGKTDKSADMWLPLWMHAMDTAYMMRFLRNHWLPETTVRAIGIDEDEVKTRLNEFKQHHTTLNTRQMQCLKLVENQLKANNYLIASMLDIPYGKRINV